MGTNTTRIGFEVFSKNCGFKVWGILVRGLLRFGQRWACGTELRFNALSIDSETSHQHLLKGL